MKIGKQNSGSYSYDWIIIDTVQITVESNSTLRYEFNFSTLLEGVEPGHYKVYGKFYYLDTYKVAYLEFDVDENPDYDSDSGGEENDSEEDSGSGGKKIAKIKMDILNDPADAQFGGAGVVGIGFSADSRIERVRLVAYIDKPDKIAVDLSGKIIVNKYCYKDSGVEIRKVAGGVKYVVGLPLFLYDNCDMKMDDGVYRVVARDCVFVDGKWEYGKNRVFSSINVSGFNKGRCLDMFEMDMEEAVEGLGGWENIGERKGVVGRIVDFLRNRFRGS